MRAVVMSIGSELLRGDIIDRNAAFLTQRLSRIGVDVRGVRQIGDDMDGLSAAFRDGVKDVDLLVCTGGLGPTADDLTRQAIAAALDEQVRVDQVLLDAIAARFQAMGRRMPASNEQQAWLIPSASALRNPRGTAPGWFVERDGHVVVAMPGPPSEMEPMWLDQVQPRLEERMHEHVVMRSLMTFGLGESTVEERVRSVIDWRPDVTIATYAKIAGVEVHVTARASSEQEASARAQEADGRLKALLGQAVLGSGDDSLSSVVGQALLARQLTLATMESATGGALAGMITDSSGSSDYFLGGIVAYSRKAKARHGVSETVMDEHGLISEETALAMALAARAAFDADVGLGTTGVAGNESVEDQLTGTVFIAISTETDEQVRKVSRPGDRETVKRFAAQSALDLLRRQLWTHVAEKAAP
ncbi:MAG: competence/damage-inducible protein A [Chloroflexota bacterium]